MCQRGMLAPAIQVSALLLALLLTACGGGGGGGGNDAGSGGSNGVQTNPGGSTPGDGGGSGAQGSQPLVYDYWINGTRLRSLVRGDSSAKPVDLGTYANKSQFWLYTRQTTFGANAELDVRNSVLLYVANNHFYRLATAGSSQPQPVQVSSEGTANSICDWHDPLLYTPDNNGAVFRYQMPGADGKCLTADDEFREIRIGMSAGDAPLTVGKERFRANQVFTADGQLAGYLVAGSGGGIFWYDTGFANPRQIASSVTVADADSGFLLLAASADGRYRLLQLATAGIYVLDVTTQQINKVIDAGGSSVAMGFFGGRFYVYRSLGNGSKSILQIPMDGSAVASELLGNLSGGALMAGQYLIYPKLAGSNMEVYSLDLASAGATARLIKTLGGSDQFTVGKNRIYYRMFPQTGGTSVAGSLNADGSDDVQFGDALWVGVGFHNGSQPAYPHLQVDSIYLAQGASFTATDGWQGGNLSWVDTATGRVGGSFGVMPAGVSNFAFLSTDYAGMGLGVGYAGTGANQITLYLRADRNTGKVSLVDQSPADFGYFWKSDWSAAE